MMCHVSDAGTCLLSNVSSPAGPRSFLPRFMDEVTEALGGSDSFETSVSECGPGLRLSLLGQQTFPS